MKPVEPKPAYTIDEVHELTGVVPHTLRYWEEEFSQLRPERNSAGQRLYRPKHLDLVLRIRELLKVEKYTIEGARQRLDEDRRSQVPLVLNLRESELVTGLVRARRQLRGILDDLEKPLEPLEGQAPGGASADTPGERELEAAPDPLEGLEPQGQTGLFDMEVRED